MRGSILSNWNVCAAVLKSGDIGFAETYLAGDWDIATISQRFSTSWCVTVRRSKRWSMARGSAARCSACGICATRTRRTGSRRNIHAHYDLGNAFYALWLDDTMTYSSALFDGTPAQSLADAQRAKYRRLLERTADRRRECERARNRLRLGRLRRTRRTRGERARDRPSRCRRNNAAYAQARIAQAGLSDREPICACRTIAMLRGQFDAIASIEMFEAVGERYWPDLFRHASRAT